MRACIGTCIIVKGKVCTAGCDLLMSCPPKLNSIESPNSARMGNLWLYVVHFSGAVYLVILGILGVLLLLLLLPCSPAPNSHLTNYSHLTENGTAWICFRVIWILDQCTGYIKTQDSVQQPQKKVM